LDNYATENQTSFTRYRQERIAHWDRIADMRKSWRGWGAYYQHRLAEIYSFLIPTGQRVLEVGCGTGELLAALKPSYGLGIDFSTEMIAEARKRHPDLCFEVADVHEFKYDATFDAIILSDTINDLWDVQAALERLVPLCKPNTRIFLNYYSRLWELPLKIARALKVATPTLYQNWLTAPDVNNLLYLANLEVIREWHEVLWPFGTPLIAGLFNRFLVRLWPFKDLALANFTLARPKINPDGAPQEGSIVSVVVPARNESGNIRSIFERTPEMGAGTELIFVEGHSRDNTYETIEATARDFPHRSVKMMRQKGSGKGDAVREGFANASGDVLMILDADLTVPPEDLVRFYDALADRKGEFINGVRLVYPMEQDAMRFFNFLGNKFFSLVFSWLLGQPVKDTLCGTKVLRKEDYARIAANRSYFGDFDPFGDFDLLFGAARLNQKIVDLPIRYRERTYGSTNIQRWKHGWLLLRMVWFAMRRIKFI